MITRKEKKRLNQYYRSIKKIAKIGKSLNLKQKERMSLYIKRVLEYCKTQKAVEYAKYTRVRDNELISNTKELVIYKQLFDAFNNLAFKIKDDEVLNDITKKELNKTLKSIIGHCKGKLNVGNKFGSKNYEKNYKN